MESLDAVIIGAGFSGIHLLVNLRKQGFRVRIFEKGSDIGGTWYWNNYPGARVDSSRHIYQFMDEELYYKFNQKFPGRDELMNYFHHLDSKLNIKSYVNFNMTLIKATFHQKNWKLSIDSNGEIKSISTKYLFLCTGFASRIYMPCIEGSNTFQGEIYHSSHWPKHEQIEMKGKRVAVIGTGASGVQIIQEIGSHCKHLTVYQRTPNLAIPMIQEKYEVEDRNDLLEKAKTHWDLTNHSFGGMEMTFNPKDAFQDSLQDRQKTHENNYNLGGFHFWLRGYQDHLINHQSNEDAYRFWVERTRARIMDIKKKDILAPMQPPHPFGTKRPSLEQNYYEIFNLNHVDVIDINQSPILEITSNGIKTQNEGIIDVDIIIYATGFDSSTGGFFDIDIQNEDGLTLIDKWKDGVESYLGMMIPSFPNLFYTYGPQAPTAFSNGTSCIQVQVNWLMHLLLDMASKHLTIVDANIESGRAWKDIVHNTWNASLFPLAKSWYQGSNIPGKVIQPLNYAGGFPSYIKALQDSTANGYKELIFQ